MTRVACFLMILIFGLISSCLMIEVIDTPEMIPNKTYSMISNDEIGYLELTIINNTENVVLKVDTCFLNNIKGVDFQNDTVLLSNTPVIIEPHDTVSIAMTTVLPQKLTPWNPIILPNRSLGCHIQMYVQLITGGFELCYDYLYTPISGYILPNVDNQIILVLENQCPWYYLYGDRMVKVLQEITFNPVVDDWKEVEITITNL